MVSCRAPSLPKIVIFTPSKSLAFSPLKSIDLEASTVKTFCVPSPLENIRPVDCRSTFTGAAAGACFFSTCRVHPRFRYTPTVSPANTMATAALHLAYFAASLFLIVWRHLIGGIFSFLCNFFLVLRRPLGRHPLSVKQNWPTLYTSAHTLSEMTWGTPSS